MRKAENIHLNKVLDISTEVIRVGDQYDFRQLVDIEWILIYGCSALNKRTQS